jgi:hypothetical protein
MPVPTELQVEVVREPALDGVGQVGYSVALCGYTSDAAAVKTSLAAVRQDPNPRAAFIREFAGLLPWTWSSVAITSGGVNATVIPTNVAGWPGPILVEAARARLTELVEQGTGGFAGASADRFVTVATTPSSDVVEYEYHDETVSTNGQTHFAVHVPALLHSLQSGPAPAAAEVFKTTYFVSFAQEVQQVTVSVSIDGTASMLANGEPSAIPSPWLDPRDRDADGYLRNVAEALGEFSDLAGQWLLFADEKRLSDSAYLATNAKSIVDALASLAGDVLHRGVLIRRDSGGKTIELEGADGLNFAGRLVSARINATELETHGQSLLDQIKLNADNGTYDWLKPNEPVATLAGAANAFAGERLAAWYAERVREAGQRAAQNDQSFREWWADSSTRWTAQELRDAGLDALRRADLIGETWKKVLPALGADFPQKFSDSVGEFGRDRLKNSFSEWIVRPFQTEPDSGVVDDFIAWLKAGARARAEALQPTEHAKRTDLTPEPHPIYLEFEAPAALGGDPDAHVASLAGVGVLMRWAHPSDASKKGEWRLLTACEVAVADGSQTWQSVGAVPFIEQRGVVTCGFAYNGVNYFASDAVAADSFEEEYADGTRPPVTSPILDVRAPSAARPWALTVPLGFGLSYEPAAFRIPNSAVLPRELADTNCFLRMAAPITGTVPAKKIGRLRYLRRVGVSGPVIVPHESLSRALQYARSVNLVAGEREWKMSTGSGRDVDAPQFALLLTPAGAAGTWLADRLSFEVRAPSCSGRTLRAWYATDWLLAPTDSQEWRQYLADTAAADRWWQTAARPEDQATLLKARFEDPAVTAIAYELYRHGHDGQTSRSAVHVERLARPSMPPSVPPDATAFHVFATTHAPPHSVNVTIGTSEAVNVVGNRVNVVVTRGAVWELRISSACADRAFAHDDPTADDPTNGAHRLQACMRSHATDESAPWVLHSPYRLVIEVGELP